MTADAPRIRFGFGLITCQRVPGDKRTSTRIYQEAIELAVIAEDLGFDSVWLSEHHFFDDGHLPSLLPMAAAIAARTSHISLGTGVLLAPLYGSPLRLAEDVATVDQISGARLILGLGAGWREEEFRLLGIPRAERGARLWAAVEAVRSIGSSQIQPKPARATGVPIWIGGSSKTTLERAARLADGYIGNYYADAETFAGQVEAIRQARAERVGAFEFALQLPVFVSAQRNAWAGVRASVHHVMATYERYRTWPPHEPPRLTPALEREWHTRGIFSNPEDAARRIGSYVQAAGGSLHFIARLYWPGLSFDAQRAALQTFAEQVIPRLNNLA